MKPFVIFCLSIISLFMTIPINGQNHTRLYTTEDRLSNSLINDILQDAVGYIWIATEDGLNRFDGQDLKRYNLGYVRVLYLSHDKSLYAGTIDGLYLYDSDADSFIKLNISQRIDMSAHVTDIDEDEEGNIYVATSGIGLRRITINKETKKSKTIHRLLPEIGDYVSSIKVCNCNLYVVTPNGFYRNQVKIDRLEMINFNDPMSENAFVEIIGNDVYLASGGLYKLDIRADVFREVQLPTHAKVSALASDGHGNILVGTDGQGIVSLASSNSANNDIITNISEPTLANKKVHSILFDRQGDLWLGLFQKGVMLIPCTHRYFNTTLTDVCALSICTDNKEQLHIGLDGNGQTVMGMLSMNDGRIIKAAYDDGLMVDNKTVTKCRAICLSKAKKDIWLGTFGSGILRYDSLLNLKQKYISTSEIIDTMRNEVINNYINCIVPVSDKLYIGTYKGLSCYNLTYEHFVIIPKTLRDAIGTKVVYHVDSLGDFLFIATSNGLVEYNQVTDKVRTMTRQDGLPSNVIVALNHDDQNNLWASTYSGLFRYDINNQKIKTFYSHDGLQGNQYSRAATLRMPNGELLFAGTNGVSSFNPLLVNNADNKDSISHDTITVTNLYVSRDECRVSLTTFNFVNPELIVYEYMLEGVDNIWHKNPQGASQLIFNNLRHGEYTLKVKAQLGGTDFASLQIPITIQPQWWQTWWAITLYFIIIFTIIALIYLATLQQQRIRHELLMQEQQHDIEEAKFQFFFNISHEIRTPLTLIINPIRELIEEGKGNVTSNTMARYEMIMRNSQRILHLINQLLDLRKIEKGQMRPAFIRTDLHRFITDIAQQFIYLAEKKGIELTIETTANKDDKPIIASIDDNLFDKVIYNLLSNAMKFTTKGSINVVTSATDTEAVITVSDTGCGLEDDKLERIFDRFYQITNNAAPQGTGTGIGLHFSKTIVSLHGGSITAQNRKDSTSGSVFTVKIPLHQADEEEALVNLPVKNIKPQETLPVFDIDKHKVHSGKRIVIVDDEQEVNDYLTAELSKHYVVKSCKNGKEAYDYLLKSYADGVVIEAVISDIMMPVMDGLTLCKKVKQNINISHLPVILLTAKHSDDDRNLGLITGADAYIAKPFDMETLRNTISSIIDNRARIAARIGDVQATKARSTGRGKKQKVELKSSDELLMERITKYIDEHISDQQLSVEPMAEVVGLSRVHLHRKLKELTGQSARDYIRNIRLKQAGILLSEKKLNVSDVAYSLGFVNLSHFSTAFRDFYGVSPRDYMNTKINDKTEEHDEDK